MAARKKKARQPSRKAAPPKRKIGRPSLYDPSKLDAVRALAGVGANEYEIAEYLGISYLTVIRWKSEHPEFCKALEVGHAAALQRVEKALFTRAIGFTRIEEKVAIVGKKKVTIKTPVYYPSEPGSLKLWLHNKDPDHWREKREVQVYSPEGKAIRTYGMAREELARTYDERVVKAEEATADPDPHAARDLGRHGREVDEPDSDAGVEPLR